MASPESTTHAYHNTYFQIGAEKIRRAAAPNDHPLFINALSDLVASHLKSEVTVNPKFLMRCARCVNPRCGESKNWYKTFCNQA